MTKVGLFYGSSTGNTEEAAEKIQEILGEDVVTLYDISEADPKDFEQYDCVIVGCPTWDTGELEAQWNGFYEDELDNVDFTGKKVAYFGMGDQDKYADNFQDAMGILEEKISSLGGTNVGQWPTDGYDFEESKAVKNGKFVGLALDNDNQEEQTDERIEKWVAQLKTDFSL
ncbi:MAG: flavodoxin FldA [Oscillatoria sp. SIO1A7]|nr:flavodoxin FldA [Oscillatoria sp. SIO1A7]